MKLKSITLVSIVIILAASSNKPEKGYNFSKLRKGTVENHNPLYSAYCKRDTASYELNAVASSFYGDYEKSLQYATKDAEQIFFEPNFDETISRKQFIASLEYLLLDSSLSVEMKDQYRRAIKTLTRENHLPTLFEKYTALDASSKIIKEAAKHHFLLINEAHFNSQNRAFTTALLQPLWQIGYRYLALEALGYSDTLLNQRGYPINNSGYYIQDPVFGNMVREALQLGYKLIPYETKKNLSGTERDLEQAKNILESTLKKDKAGKVVIHAGYGHILESGSSTYHPMGEHLKKLGGMDILTIDQERMTDLLDATKLNPYYSYVKNTIGLQQPLIFSGDEILVDPLNYGSVDLQVYHPPTTFIHGRPSWLLAPTNKIIPLPKSFLRYKGSLIEVRKIGESEKAIPVDRTIIKTETGIIVTPGKYKCEIVDCNGSLIAECDLQVQ